ncbi:MAG: YHS domain-containing protein [Elusimicrobia bacterium]|nr:YHS domain-containing protein [Elusimicrobiota bacterium]
MNKKIKVTQKTKVVDYKGQKYYLCCPGCDSEFIKNPEKFVR